MWWIYPFQKTKNLHINEKIRPSLEPSHAFAVAIKLAPKLSEDTIIVVNSCGDAKKDELILTKRLGKDHD